MKAKVALLSCAMSFCSAGLLYAQNGGAPAGPPPSGVISSQPNDGAPGQPNYGTPGQPNYGTPGRPNYGGPVQPNYGTPVPNYGTNVTAQVPLSQLQSQLQSLRMTVDQTLPMLTDFNQRVASQPGQQGLVGALSGIFSGKNNSRSTGQEITNVLSALGSMVNTNAQGNATINPTTVNDLAALQNDLRQVQQILQKLNLGNPVNGAVPPNGSLTPTGR